MPIVIGEGLSFCGRALTPEELALIRQITGEYANLALTELAATVCELLGWQRPNGGLKTRECYLFLRELHKRGWLPWLPAPQLRLRRHDRVRPIAEPVTSPDVLSGPLQTYRPIRLQLLESAADHRLFRCYLNDHHYLGYRAPYGAQRRYFVRAAQPDLPPLAALLLTSAAWRMGPARPLYRLDGHGAPKQSAASGEQQPLSDSAVGAHSPSGEPCAGTGRAATPARLASTLCCRAAVIGNTGGPAPPGRLLPRRQLG